MMHGSSSCVSVPVEVMNLLDTGTCVVNLHDRNLEWCSPAFIDCTGLIETSPLDDVIALYPCLGDYLHDPARLSEISPDETLLKVGLHARLLRDGWLSLRLLGPSSWCTDPIALQSLQRHLEERERLLFTSQAMGISELVSTLAHEINQPIGTVVNVLQGIKLRLHSDLNADDLARHDEPSEQIIQWVGLAIEQAQFCSRIIACIRDFTHARKPQLQALEFPKLVKDALSLMDWELLRDGVEVNFEPPAGAWFVRGDETMLQQVVVNLFRNALDAMRDLSQGRRHLAVRLYEQADGKKITLSIKDRGCGLPPDAGVRIFLPFQSNKPNGMGIGLNICRSFMEVHQGSLWFSRNDAEGAEEPGSTFYVTLPLLPIPSIKHLHEAHTP